MGEKQQLVRLGELLIEEGVITLEELAKSLDEAGPAASALRDALHVGTHVRREDLAATLAADFVIPKLGSIKELKIDPELAKLVPVESARKHEMVPLAKFGHILCVGKASYYNRAAVIELRKVTGLKIKVVLCPEEQVAEAIERLYGALKPVTDLAPLVIPVAAPATPLVTPVVVQAPQLTPVAAQAPPPVTPVVVPAPQLTPVAAQAPPPITPVVMPAAQVTPSAPQKPMEPVTSSAPSPADDRPAVPLEEGEWVLVEPLVAPEPTAPSPKADVAPVPAVGVKPPVSEPPAATAPCAAAPAPMPLDKPPIAVTPPKREPSAPVLPRVSAPAAAAETRPAAAPAAAGAPILKPAPAQSVVQSTAIVAGSGIRAVPISAAAFEEARRLAEKQADAILGIIAMSERPVPAVKSA